MKHTSVTQLFHELLPLDATARDEKLATVDAELRTEVRSLLQAHDAAAATPGFQDLLGGAGGPRPGDRIGPYEIVEHLGAGGMGAVFLARRADEEFEKQVAIKVLQGGLATDELVRRFRSERQILAGLDHENIARLLDGGTTDHGLPYVVMEYVEGEPIDTYCRAHAMDLAARLRLFVHVCRAVHYAHRNLVVHRDLKPGNILVASDGTPKLLDFGIAKLLGPVGEDVLVTGTRMRMMTPQYASPEQILGAPITTASDTYALGLLLYLLLTGRPPYLLEGRTATELEHIVCDEAPPRPSTVVPDRRRAARLRGDLDTIVQMALRKEPERRYASAEALARDVERHLGQEPVTARPDTVRYRVGKFVRRNRAGVAAAVLVVLALAAGLFATLRQARIARGERDRAERLFVDMRGLANRALKDFHDSIRNLPGATRAREKLVATALEYLERLAEDRGDDPTLDMEIAEAYVRVAYVQGNPNNPNLGDADGALKSYRTALDIARRLEGPDAHRLRGLAKEGIGDVLASRGDIEAAVEHMKQAIAEYEATPECQWALPVAYLKLGDKLGNPNFLNAGRPDEAMQAYRRAAQEGARGGDPHQRFAYLIRERLGDMEAVRENWPLALKEYAQAQEIAAVRHARDLDDAQARRDLAVTHEKVGNVRRAVRDHKAALQAFGEARRHFAALAKADPANTNARRSLTIIMEKVADTRELAGDRPGALELHRTILKEREALHALDAANRTWKDDLARSLQRLAELAEGEEAAGYAARLRELGE